MKVWAAVGILLFSAASLSFGQNIANWNGSLPGTGSPMGGAFPADFGRINGTVISSDGRPQKDVLVQIHDFGTRRVAASVYTDPDGGFSFDELPSGMYQVIATRDTDTVNAEVNVSGSVDGVTLRLSARDPNAPPAQSGRISLSELKAPPRAREAYAKAEQAAARGRSEEMFKHLQKALDIYPEYAPALSLRAAFLLDKDNVAQAVEDLDKAIHADSNFAQAHALMAGALNRMNKFDDAIRAADRASALAPTSWQPHYEMAKSYFGKADYQRALQQLTHAQSQLGQDYAPIHYVRAQVLLRLSNYTEAVNELTTFLKIAPNAPNAASVRNVVVRLNTFVNSGTELAKDEQRRPEQ